MQLVEQPRPPLSEWSVPLPLAVSFGCGEWLRGLSERVSFRLCPETLLLPSSLLDACPPSTLPEVPGVSGPETLSVGLPGRIGGSEVGGVGSTSKRPSFASDGHAPRSPSRW